MATIDSQRNIVKKISGDLRAMSHPLRLKIIQLIKRNGSINVNRIYRALDMEQSMTSQHLRVLRQHGIVDAKRDGKMIYYSVNEARIHEIMKQSVDFIFA